MYARAVDEATFRLRELRQEEWQDLVLAGLVLGLSLAATQVYRSLAVPLFLGGVVVGILGLRAVVRRWELVEELSEKSDAYVIPEVLERASREATMERRRSFAASIRSRLKSESPDLGLDLGPVAHELEALAAELADDALALEPSAAVACSRLVSDICGEPFFDEDLAPEALRSRIRQVHCGFTIGRPAA